MRQNQNFFDFFDLNDDFNDDLNDDLKMIFSTPQ